VERDLLHEIDWKARPVHDCYGERVGKVADVIDDAETTAPEWLLVDTGLFGGHNSFVPLTGAEFGTDAVTVRFEKEQIKDAPRAKAGEVLSAEDEARLYEHYGLTARQTETGNVVTAHDGPDVSVDIREDAAKGPDPAAAAGSLEEGHLGTGRPDYLLIGADRAKREGLSYAAEFERLVLDTYSDADGDLAAWYASRPLKDHESTPISIVLAAVEAAAADGDPALVRETIKQGLVFLARWPSYLAGTAGHPELALDSNSAPHAADEEASSRG